jgi:hypothetical protein
MGSEIATLDPNDEDFGQWDPAAPTHRVTRAVIWRNGVMKAVPNLLSAARFRIHNTDSIPLVTNGSLPE